MVLLNYWTVLPDCPVDGLVEEGLKVGTAVALQALTDILQGLVADRMPPDLLADYGLEDAQTLLLSGQRHLHFDVESAHAKNGCVNEVDSVGGCHHDHLV